MDFDEDLLLVHGLDDLADIGALLLQMLQLLAQHSHLYVKIRNKGTKVWLVIKRIS